MKSKPRILGFILIPAFLTTACGEKPRLSEMRDSRDGKVYKTVEIGNMEWMAENLAFLPSSDSAGVWVYNNDSAFLHEYGLLYDWKTACLVCPDGWELPSDEDWWKLADELGGSFVASGKLREIGYRHWQKPNVNASGTSGFAALPAGVRDSTGAFTGAGTFAAFWTSSKYNESRAWYRSLRHNEDRLFRCNGDHYGSKAFGMSVRCVRKK